LVKTFKTFLQKGIVYYSYKIRFFNTKKAFKKLYIFILRRFGLFLIHLQSKNYCNKQIKNLIF